MLVQREVLAAAAWREPACQLQVPSPPARCLVRFQLAEVLAQLAQLLHGRISLQLHRATTRPSKPRTWQQLEPDQGTRVG
eukprot:5702634-Pyramimonas_sp.AAC.1